MHENIHASLTHGMNNIKISKKGGGGGGKYSSPIVTLVFYCSTGHVLSKACIYTVKAIIYSAAFVSTNVGNSFIN